MQQYIQNVVQDIINNNVDFENVYMVLPSRRATIFVKNELKNKIKTFKFLPKIISIEEFVFDITKINQADNLVLAFEFYKIYLENTPKNKIETFEEFSNWASILITDFNEIDSYLINSKQIFNYLKDINRIENWFKNESKNTELSKKYIYFFEKIETYYIKFYQHLLKLKIGYQGLLYREANKNIDNYIISNSGNKYLIVGFNALNNAEKNIIQALLLNNMAEIYFDLDQFILDENISANNFIKHYKNNWDYFSKHDFKFITNQFKNAKEIQVIGIPKNVTQSKYASSIIEKNYSDKASIALVLANEDILTSTINSLPRTVENVNITMGFPLKNIHYSNLFYLLFQLHLNKIKLGSNENFYFKDVLAVVNHPIFKEIFDNNITKTIKQNNYIFINQSKLISLSKLNNDLLSKIFNNWNEVNQTINYCLEIIKELKLTTKTNIEIEYLSRFEQIFNQIKNLNSTYGYIKTLDGLSKIFNQLVSKESISFKGNSLQGLQIMGMLETRVLEFDTVIITSVNEGFLPSGKSNNSFIPFDVKLEYGLPTFREKDAIFSYHFFRLIARAKNVYLLYNTETDDFGSGEQSRFITQLELLQDKLPNLTLTKTIVSPKIDKEQTELKRIEKNDSILNQLIKVNNKGFSPTALTNYIYNPISFYKQKALSVYQIDEIEETIAANTLGNIVHKVLENFYLPLKGKILAIEDILKMKKKVDAEVKSVFKKEYTNGDITKGKNLIAFEISKQYVRNFLNYEISEIKKGNKIKIIDLEVDLNASILIDTTDFNINLKGQADRIDECNGVLRIIDYKTGKVEQSSLNLVNKNTNNWDKLITDYKYSKAFQVLLYAYMYAKMNKLSFENNEIESGIISFKNLRSGFMKVNKDNISNNDIELFEMELKALISEIFNLEIPFIENENLPY